MATSSLNSLVLLSLVSSSFLFTFSQAKTTSFRPKALVIPITKDTSTKLTQYTTVLSQRTPLVPLKLTVDLGGDFLWVDCDKGYTSSTYRPARCRSAQCNLAESKACGECVDSPKPGCNKNTCSLFPYNPFITTSTGGELASDVISVASTDNKNPGRHVTAKNVLFTCGSTSLLDGLSRSAVGIAGLGRKKIGLPSQLAAAFSFSRKFAVCLPSSPSAKGVVFFGDGPYTFLPDFPPRSQINPKDMIKTPLILNPVSTSGSFFEGESSSDYFIGVTAIKVHGLKVNGINSTLLKIDQVTGVGGTKISTVEPYTILQSSIYKAVVDAFINAVKDNNVPRVKAVAPFKVCYAADGFGVTRVGPGVPQIDLVFHNNDAVWNIFGANAMVKVNEKVLCLGFLDGGDSPTTSIVIGSHQIEDNLLYFDLASSVFGFTSSMLFRQTSCSNFNFTTNPNHFSY